ncbi:MAG: hypothetical protein K5673_03690 [Lachnospiraceae bacterium]|nr:hypothetical protein [Lachnospiraceae bacterium]
MELSEFIKKARKLGLRLGFMKFIGYEAVFSCAFRKKDVDGVYCLLPESDDYWYADPLIYMYNDREIVFMERVDRHTGLGCIACADITDGRWGEIVPVIENNFHMSFPMCFEWDGELYMIPETQMDEHINLYRCIGFPYEWELAGQFMDGHRLVDTIVLDRQVDEITFLGSEFDPEDDFYSRFYKFSLHREEDGTITCNDLGLVSESYTLYSRMAGYPLTDQDTDGNEHIVYPIQRSTSGVYGYSVMFMRDDAYSGQKIKEMLPSDIRLDMHRKLIGVHTYSRSGMYEVIDVQYLVRKIKR